jgi:dolichyl-phosphate beta-glucosyltransferase
MNPQLSLIIPAYNEEPRIVKSLDSAINYLNFKNYNYEIVVVDDGSHDATSELVKSYGHGVKLIQLGANIGKGAAVRAGMLAAVGDIRVFTDADFSTPIYEIEKLLNIIQSGTDICIGSRALNPKMIKKHQPFYREWMGKTFNKFVQFMLVKGIKDTQCGFKGFRNNAAISIFDKAKINGFSFDVEILYLAKKMGFHIEQVPVEWYNDERSTVNPISDSINMLIELFKIKKIHKFN